MKCRVFEDMYGDTLEKQVNDWLKDMIGIEILHTAQSSCAKYGEDVRDGQTIGNTLTVFYK